MIDLKKKLEDLKNGVQPVPFTHPPLDPEDYRVEFKEIKASSDKATLFVFDGYKNNESRHVWIPRSLFKMRYGSLYGVTASDRRDVIDVKDWFYKKHIE